MRRVATTQARAGGERSQIGGQEIVGAAQHEFGLQGVDDWRRRIDEAEIHASATEMQCGAPGKQCGPDHARCAAEDAGAAVASLMRIAPARGKVCCEQSGGEELAGGRGEVGRGFGIVTQVESGEADLAAVIGAVGGVQARLGTDEGEGVRGPDAGSESASGIRVKAAWRVERQQRAGVTRGQCVGCRDQRRISAFRCAGEADPEQAVDDEMPASGSGDGGDGGSSRSTEGAMRRLCISREFVGCAQENDADVEEPCAQAFGDDEGIAAVVARPGEDQDPAAGGQLLGSGGGHGSGASHQRQIGVGGLQGTQGVGTVER